MIRPVLERLAVALPPPRVIFDETGTSPYRSSWLLARGGGYDLNLPRFHRGDLDAEHHSHPWRWAVSLILAGGYVEERRTARDTVVARVLRAGALNFLRADTFHRITLLDGEAWTLFVTGPKVSNWSFWDPETKWTTPWREFVSRRRDPVAHARGHRDE